MPRKDELRELGNIACREALKDKHFRQVDLGNGCYQSRRHIDDQMLPLRAHLDDQQFDRDDEFVSIEVLELAWSSITCEMLSPEEMMIRLEEEAELDEPDPKPEVTASSHESDDSEEEPDELNLVDYFAQLFGITSRDHSDIDEVHLSIPCNESQPRYRSRPNWALT